jgi:hypothetical protein
MTIIRGIYVSMYIYTLHCVVDTKSGQRTLKCVYIYIYIYTPDDGHVVTETYVG